MDKKAKRTSIIVISVVGGLLFIYPVFPFLYALFTGGLLSAVFVVTNPIYCLEQICVENEYTAAPLTLDEAELYIEEQLCCDIEELTLIDTSDETRSQRFSFSAPQYGAEEIQVYITSYINDKTTLGIFSSTEKTLRMNYTAQDIRVDFFERCFEEMGYDVFALPDDPDFLQAAKDVKAAYEETKRYISENYGEEFMRQLFEHGRIGVHIPFTCGDIKFGAYCAEDISAEQMADLIEHWYNNRVFQLSGR